MYVINKNNTFFKKNIFIWYKYMVVVKIFRQTFSGTGTSLTMNQFGSFPIWSSESYDATSNGLFAYTDYIKIPASNVPSGYTHNWQFVSWIYDSVGQPMKYEDMMTWLKFVNGAPVAGTKLAINSIIGPNDNYEFPSSMLTGTNYYFNIVNISGLPYIATFVYGDGVTINTTATYTFNTYNTFPTPTRTGYTFSGWATSPNIGAGTSLTWTHAGNITFDALWTANKYTIRYNTNGGNGGSTANTTAVYNNNLTIRNNGFTRTGYSFIGWSTTSGNSNSVSATYIENTNIAHPTSADTLDLYAVWALSYTITFNNSGKGEVINTVLTGISNSVISNFPALNNLIGFNFGGWMDNNVVVLSITLTTTNVILYAKWVAGSSVSFYSVQKLFGGNYPIYLSEYYLNNTLVYSPGGIGIPTSGQISLSVFSGKYKSPYIPIKLFTGDRAANMDETDARSMFYGYGSDDGNSSITMGFIFYWFGTDYGTTNNIQWNANNVLTFGGGGVGLRNFWSANTGKGVLMGQSDRYLKIAKQFDPYITTGFNVKRFIVKSYNYYSDYSVTPPMDTPIEMEIILTRGPTLQYIDIRLNKWTATQPGIWNISDGTTFYDTLSGFTTKLTAGSSITLSGSLTGTGWGVSNNSLVLPSSSIDMLINGANLLLYLDGYNINGNLNVGQSTRIPKWVNLANSALIVKQDTINSQPLYSYGGGLSGCFFDWGKAFVSDINLHGYPDLNIFVVLKKTSVIVNVVRYIWTVSSEGSATGSVGRRLFYVDVDDSGNYGSYSYIGLNVGSGKTYYFIYKFPLFTFVVLNCEYRSNGNLGRLSINGESVDFINGTPIINAQIILYIGSSSNFAALGDTNSFLGTIHEFIVINGLLTDTERRKIYNLLYTKWNVDVFDDIRGMGKNLILRHDAKNVDGDANSRTNVGSTISKWYNSAPPLIQVPNSTSEARAAGVFVTVQTTVSGKPTYNTNSVAFTTGKGLVSNIALYNYQIINIIVVWTHKVFPTGTESHILWTDSQSYRSLSINSNNIINFTHGYGDSTNITNPFINTNTTVIYNLEYNLVGQPGNFYINNISRSSFTTLIAANPTLQGTSTTYFGNNNLSNSIKGDIFEIIVINRLLTDIERTNIYTLLKAKWNVS